MANYQKAGVKLTNTQLNKLKLAAKSKTGTILKINQKSIQDEDLLHELFLTAREATQKRNAFAKNMSTHIKLGKAQISKIIQSGGSFASMLANFGQKALTNTAIPLANDNLPGLLSNLAPNEI